ncbi:putative PIN family toxin of toxin-antitoxin system [Gelidibacter algens]|uniref:Putative PIN family toxin of toxin-antitoxin system n=1 Tax=Gelidibacter algens TaxID=49280 RepID=A0A327SA10_9FLAO|nr:putative toxin-antitoxin system toxin component, PIN family [Gelidibacter algens]RAJ25840.1 putative PIN family toxin of toxin-antitoxin system [Gelidibacter algens]
MVEVKSDIKICRDAKDNFLLNLSVDSNAEYLITGDANLLVLKKIGKTKIIEYSDFVDQILGQ